jgi:hypothetical protein
MELGVKIMSSRRTLLCIVPIFSHVTLKGT